MNLAIIKHENDPRKFLFQVPDHVYLKKGDRVICKTRRGEQDGTCVYDSFTLDGLALDIFISVMGAKKPLAPIIGEYSKAMYEKTEDCILTVDAARVVRGRWVAETERTGHYAHCSECGCRCAGYIPNYKYCPNCGSKMDAGMRKDA